jgi:peptidoglycan/xylan/chitin deacetylase (PgdA/CDA1 family)
MVIKSLVGFVEKVFTGITYPQQELIVVNYHSTPKKFNSNFEKQVVFFKKNFNIISPADLENYFFNKNWASKKCSLLFTFDDGLQNNLNAVSVLEKHNICAMFFVLPEFINTPIEKQKSYYLKNIRPIVNPNIDAEPEDFNALNWNELKKLLSKGHSIGAHTQTHTLVAKNSDKDNSKFEIVTCKENIEKELNIKVTSFCSINNTALSVHKKEKELIESNYKFHFTTFPGSNNNPKNPLLIKRRNIECFWLLGAVYFAIGKFDLKRWKIKTEQFDKL